MTDLDELIERATQKGSDKAFRRWVSFQASCLTSDFREWVDGVGRCESAHVRRAGKSGTAFKEAYACVPLTREQHDYQHRHGEAACIERFTGWDVSRDEARAWFDRQRVMYLERWMES